MAYRDWTVTKSTYCLFLMTCNRVFTVFAFVSPYIKRFSIFSIYFPLQIFTSSLTTRLANFVSGVCSWAFDQKRYENNRILNQYFTRFISFKNTQKRGKFVNHCLQWFPAYAVRVVFLIKRLEPNDDFLCWIFTLPL